MALGLAASLQRMRGTLQQVRLFHHPTAYDGPTVHLQFTAG
jgi:hypothetical protein